MQLTQKYLGRIFTNFNWFRHPEAYAVNAETAMVGVSKENFIFTNFNWFRHPEAYAVNAETAMVGGSKDNFIYITDFLFTPVGML